MSKSASLFASLYLIAISIPLSHGQVPEENSSSAETKSESETAPDPKAWLTPLEVHLTDEHGEPVVGASVVPYALRVVEVSGHGFWNYAELGPPQEYFSDENGVATILYPSRVAARPEPYTTRLVSFQVRHSDFVREIVHFSLGPDPAGEPVTTAEVELKRGCELQISAVDEQGTRIEKFAVMTSGQTGPSTWADDGKGGRRTSALDDGTWQFMLVVPRENGETLFSGLLPLRVRPDQALAIRNVKVSPGMRLIGKLSNNIPRPVKNGYVITTTVPKVVKDEPVIQWYATAEISEDGSFELPSLPRSGRVQVIALADGWLSTTTYPDANRFVMGQVFDVEQERDEKNNELRVEIAMEQTGTLEVTLLDMEDRPLKDGKLSSWPNQRHLLGGSTFLGQRNESIAAARAQLSPPAASTQADFLNRDLPFLERPVVDGKAVLRGLPIGSRQQLALVHDDFRLMGAEEGWNGVPYTLDSAEPKKMTLRVNHHESPSARKELEGLGKLLDAARKAVSGDN